jgi:hypothetical protein
MRDLGADMIFESIAQAHQKRLPPLFGRRKTDV